ncbi:Hypothetical predicted protein [Pelobates cultripes]|uniref:Uncharacterized protein n=1 Tax=Pelobates cultripes TaxID=61616 RepID=A0AAD1R3D0_PELCU|nr:Hypothetical predicted protein [Pelobates cultripes]
MAPLEDGPSCSSSKTSLSDLRELETLTRSKQADKPSDRKSGEPVTEDTLLDELRRNIITDISAFREEISGVSARQHDTEVTTAGHETRLTTLEQELSTLRCEQAKTQHHMATMEDWRRWKNVKDRGLPDTSAMAEIPQPIPRLLTQLFSAKQAKLLTLDGSYRLPAPPASVTGAHRDVIIRFQNGPDKQVFMTATCNKSSYTFEDHQLTFYPDLSRDWRRSLRTLTVVLTKYKVPHRWGAPRSLLIPHESETLKVLEDTEIPNTLQKLGPPATSEGSPTPAPVTQPYTWDPSRVRPFIPNVLLLCPELPKTASSDSVRFLL